ncbi:MAG: DUF4349 domain-containing protein [Actinomycetota bacterium]
MHRVFGGKSVLLIVVLVGVATACSGSGAATTAAFETVGDELGVAGAPATTAAGAFETTAPAASEEGDLSRGGPTALGTGGVAQVTTDPVDLGRDIVFTAEVIVAATDVMTAGEEASRIIQSLGGLVFGQRTVGPPEPQTVLVFKVFPEDFQTALDRLGAIGELRSQNISADDVTERVVDLESRVNTAQASVERLRGFLANAQAIDVIAEIENQLLVRETELETLRGQLRTLEDAVALATITLTITEASSRPELRLDVTAYPGHDGAGLSCPGSAGLEVEEGGAFTLCLEVTNVGDTLLKGFEVRDPILDIELDDLIVVFGDPAATIEPGQSILFAYEALAERDIRTQTTVTAQPVAEDGTPLPGREAAATVSIFINAVDPGGIPTFAEGLEASWELLIRFGQVTLLILGSLLPFVWVPIGLLLLARWRRTQKTKATVAPPPDAAAREPIGVGSRDE